jgi:sulfopyruvate decarboxylase TPP-binding subunit
MAQPNIINLTRILGNTAFLNVSTVATNVVVNPASSGSAYKINTLMIANVDGTNSADITASIFAGGVENKIASTVTVPADATLVLISKDTTIYLEENEYIQLTASANSDLWATCSYEDLS